MLNGNKTAKKIKTVELPKIRLAATTAPNTPVDEVTPEFGLIYSV